MDKAAKEGLIEVYSAFITIKGKRIYASSYGLKAFRFFVKPKKEKK